jgi:hypothetical protein
MEGGSTGTSSAAGTYSPPESKLASGKQESTAGKSSKRGPRKLNKIGRRYQLAAELITTVPWLHNANRARIAWIIRDLADAGWTALEVQAAAERLPLPARGAFRPSGLLASRLASCHLLYTTQDRRRVLVEDWQDCHTAARDRHQEHALTSQGPSRQSVRNLMAEAVRRVQEAAWGPAPTDPPADEPDDPTPLRVEDLDKATVLDMRAEATRNPAFILDSIALGMTERDARRLFTNWLVDQAYAADARLTPAF